MEKKGSILALNSLFNLTLVSFTAGNWDSYLSQMI